MKTNEESLLTKTIGEILQDTSHINTCLKIYNENITNIEQYLQYSIVDMLNLIHNLQKRLYTLENTQYRKNHIQCFKPRQNIYYSLDGFTNLDRGYNTPQPIYINQYQDTFLDEVKTEDGMKQYIAFLNDNKNNWHDVARKDQILPEGNWKTWLLKAGRGFGKSRAAAEGMVDLILSGKALNIGLVGSNLICVSEVMLNSDSGILTALKNRRLSDDNLRYKYTPSRKRVDIYVNYMGNRHVSHIYLFNGNQHHSLRGFEFDHVWMDEWLRFNCAQQTLNQVKLCLRKGDSRCIISTTPIKSTNDQALSTLIKDPFTYLTEGSSLCNYALSENFTEYAQEYQYNRNGEREIKGDVQLTQSWTQDLFIRETPPEDCDIYRVGIDMAVGNGLIGMILIGLKNNKTYVIGDYSTYDNTWLKTLKALHKQYYPIEIVYESNQGGNLIGSLIFSAGVRCNIIDVFANKSKKERHFNLYMHYTYGTIIHNYNLDLLENDLIFNTNMDRVDALWCSMFEIKRYLYAI